MGGGGGGGGGMEWGGGGHLPALAYFSLPCYIVFSRYGKCCLKF